MASIREVLIKRANEIREKQAFQPMPGGQPPADPSQQGGAPMDPSQGGAPMGDSSQMGMDPSQMGMDPSMMGGMPPGMGMGGMGMGMPPPPATIGQLSVTDFQTIMMDMLSQVLGPLMGGGDAAGAPPPEVAPQGDAKTISNTEISDKLDALTAALAQLTGAGAGDPTAGMPAPAAAPAPMPGAGAEMGFGGQSAMMGGQGQMAQPGMEVSASVKPVRNSLADMIIAKTSQARRG